MEYKRFAVRRDLAFMRQSISLLVVAMMFFSPLRRPRARVFLQMLSACPQIMATVIVRLAAYIVTINLASTETADKGHGP